MQNIKLIIKAYQKVLVVRWYMLKRIINTIWYETK